MTKETFEAALENDLLTQTFADPAALTQERGKTHGSFADHARITQRLKFIIVDEMIQRNRRGQEALNHQQVEALDMIAHKIGRIIAGDPTFQDHWDDIGGYAHIANKRF